MNIRYWVRRWRGGWDCFVHRRGPVPDTACRKASRRSMWRSPRTSQEIRANVFLARDEDCVEHGVTSRASRLPGGYGKLTHVWDDRCFARRGDSWKHYRDRQHRG